MLNHCEEPVREGMAAALVVLAIVDVIGFLAGAVVTLCVVGGAK